MSIRVDGLPFRDEVLPVARRRVDPWAREDPAEAWQCGQRLIGGGGAGEGMPRGLKVTPWGGDLCPRVGPLRLLQLALGGCHPAPPSDPRVRGLSPRERGVCGWPQPAAWNAGGPCNEQLSHPKEKQAHLQKPRGARWGLGTGCEGGASWSAFLLSRGGEPGQRGLRASPSLRGASAGPRGERAGKHLEEGSSGDTAAQRTGWEGALCRESADPSTRAPHTSECPGALQGSPPRASVSPTVQLRVSMAWDALWPGRV